MVKITYIDSGGTARTVEGEVGSTVMETAIKNSVPEIEAECGGACACSTCHVYFEEGWYFVPLQIALALQQAGYYSTALDWFRTIYDYSAPVAVRKIGLQTEDPATGTE